LFIIFGDYLIFQTIPSIKDFLPLILLGLFIGGGIILLKLGLIFTKAETKRDMQWVAISFFIQIATIFFISSPLFLMGIIGAFDEGPPIGAIIPIILLSAFIDLNLINIIHKLGIKRAIWIVILIIGPIIASMYIIGDLFANPPDLF
jgi:hypothetical protein